MRSLDFNRRSEIYYITFQTLFQFEDFPLISLATGDG